MERVREEVRRDVEAEHASLDWDGKRRALRLLGVQVALYPADHWMRWEISMAWNDEQQGAHPKRTRRLTTNHGACVDNQGPTVGLEDATRVWLRPSPDSEPEDVTEAVAPGGLVDQLGDWVTERYAARAEKELSDLAERQWEEEAIAYRRAHGIEPIIPGDANLLVPYPVG